MYSDSTTLRFICNAADKCREFTCAHKKPHSPVDCHTYPCKCWAGVSMWGSKCVRVSVPIDDTREQMWSALRGELADLQGKGVRSIDPVLVSRFMDYIEQAAEVK